MNFIVFILLNIIGASVLQMWLPWWVIVPFAFALSLMIKQKSFSAFLSAFISIFLLWSVYAYRLSSANDNILAAKIAKLLPLHGNVVALILITGFIGGLVAGLASLSGRLLVNIFVVERKFQRAKS